MYAVMCAPPAHDCIHKGACSHRLLEDLQQLRADADSGQGYSQELSNVCTVPSMVDTCAIGSVVKFDLYYIFRSVRSIITN